jgi:triosephosphate isomerase
MHWAPSGAYTGEISAAMLIDAGIDLVELGHSERRGGFGETDADLNRKVRAALHHGLRPLLCVGDSADERDAGASPETTVRQIKLAFAGLSDEDIGRCLVAYEPTWAIGEHGVAAAPEHIATVHAHIHEVLRDLTPHPVPVLYGGSVTYDNAFSLVSEPTVDGLFIGRAAWQPEDFVAIIEMITSARVTNKTSDVVRLTSI